MIVVNAKNTSCWQLAAIDSSLKPIYLAANKNNLQNIILLAKIEKITKITADWQKTIAAMAMEARTLTSQ